ncbi:GNAT family N-acetyltransferase [Vibrio metschnikovii]|uniref:GNAT family N-acetyltransferase n=1 Tax=Vibrio metschnikovii TaxID=28172 RepID=UPI0029F960F3|nr:GNAT family N-acetyltransferase [Vibrio metschnikovii]EKO3793846.1 GNAT family N-acetyltransferase [Vibrio metschnikovii]EKO3888597.1 GNAT family N-acetyltransferase [Vibrio metschnikovii]EKO3937237.1 GNAT family N-acetyltransferase [Vibrio metschnikovii]
MIEIRKYQESDALDLWAIFYHTVRNVNLRDYSQAQVEAWAPDDFSSEIWQRKMNLLSPFVAEIDGKIVGYSDLQENGLIDHFFCHHEHQGQGVGRQLMEHVLRMGELQGITRFYSEVSITARPFYERFGFNVIQEQTIEVRGQKLCNFVMEKFS